MAASIIATVGSASANSFGTLAEAETYHETVIHADVPWAGADTLKIPALIMAQQQMTALICWTGYPTDLVQRLPWPRNGMFYRHEMSFVLSTVIPEEVKWCQFELARLLAADDRTGEYDVDTNGILHLRAGPVTLKFKDGFNPGPPVIPQVAWSLLIPSWYESITGVMNSAVDLERY